MNYISSIQYMQLGIFESLSRHGIQPGDSIERFLENFERENGVQSMDTTWEKISIWYNDVVVIGISTVPEPLTRRFVQMKSATFLDTLTQLRDRLFEKLPIQIKERFQMISL